MPNQFFNNQVIPTYNSPEQKAESEKMNMLNNPLSIDAYQEYPIQSQNGAFTEGTNNQIKPPELYGNEQIAIGGMGANTNVDLDNKFTGDNIVRENIPIGTVKDGKKWNGTQWEAVGYDTGSGGGDIPIGTIKDGHKWNGKEWVSITGTDTTGDTGTDVDTGGGYNDHIPIGTMKDGLTWNGKAWVNVNTGTDTDVVIEEDVTGDDTGGDDDTNGDDTNGDNIAPTGGTGTDTGFTSWTGQQGPTGNWMNVLPWNWRDMSHQYGPDYSQAASTSQMQNPFTNITGDMQSGLQYFRDQGIGVGAKYGRYFQDYDPAREESAQQQFGFGQKESMTGGRTGLMGLTQQQGMGGFAGGPDVGRTAAARGIRGQFGAQQEQAALGLREDIYGMRREQEDDWWTTLSRIEQARGEQFGTYNPNEPPPVDPYDDARPGFEPPASPMTGDEYWYVHPTTQEGHMYYYDEDHGWSTDI